MFVKTCTNCGRELPTNRFYRMRTSTDGLRPWCIDCCKAANKKYYNHHREQLINHQKEYVASNANKISDYQKKYYTDNKTGLTKYNKEYRNKRRSFTDSLKTPCQKCGESRLYLIDFHHKNPSEKTFEISDIFKRSDCEIISEVKKCVCLCSNCHREFHHFYGIKPKNPIEALEEYLS